MSAATITPSQVPGSRAVAPTNLLGRSLRAVKVFTTVAFSVAVLGEYADKEGQKDPGIVRR